MDRLANVAHQRPASFAVTIAMEAHEVICFAALAIRDELHRCRFSANPTLYRAAYVN